jgi:dihydrofolate reductase
MTPPGRPRFRLYVAISLDGFIASADGGVDWLNPYDAYECGFGEFLATVGSIVMGRKSYEQMLGFGPWPYAGKRTVVMTRRRFAPSPPDTECSDVPVEALADRLAKETTNGDVFVFGGGEVARSFLNARRLDTLELCIVPVLIGDGISLFGQGTRRCGLRLVATQRYANDCVRVDYDVLAD